MTEGGPNAPEGRRVVLMPVAVSGGGLGAIALPNAEVSPQ